MTVFDELLVSAPDPDSFEPTQPDVEPAGFMPPDSRFVAYEEPLYDALLMRNHPTKVHCVVCEAVETPFGVVLVPRSICVVDKSIVN